jgi:hypothetical protein
MFNLISRVETFLTTGPWWWRMIGAAISIGALIAVAFALQ